MQQINDEWVGLTVPDDLAVRYACTYITGGSSLVLADKRFQSIIAGGVCHPVLGFLQG